MLSGGERKTVSSEQYAVGSDSRTIEYRTTDKQKTFNRRFPPIDAEWQREGIGTPEIDKPVLTRKRYASF